MTELRGIKAGSERDRQSVQPLALSRDAAGVADSHSEEQLDHLMSLGARHGLFSGAVVLVRHRNEVIFHKAYGHSFKYEDARTLTSSPIAARPDTIYDLASITKLFTATSAMQLVDEGRLCLDDCVSTHIPEFAANGKARLTVRQLLTHLGGLPAHAKLWELAASPVTRMSHVLEIEPCARAGTRYVYSDIGLIALGRLVESIDGRPLDRVAAKRITGPLGLQHTRYTPASHLRSAIAATEDESYVGRGMVWGEVHDENAWALGGAAGHAGLFGTAQDLSVFGQVYLNGGAYNGVRLLETATVAAMTRNQTGALASRGLGWDLNAPHYMGKLASPQAYGHTGFTGVSLVVDPQRQLVLVLLTNRVHPTRNGPDVNPIRQAVADIVIAAVDAVQPPTA